MESSVIDPTAEHLRRAAAVTDGDLLEASRLISEVERRSSDASVVMRALHPRCGSAHLVGVTGPPGAGKSTLVAAMVKELRKRSMSVGVVAVDPSSPFSGGALLGDRDRMTDLTGDREVFVRSLAARGAGGGLATAVNDTVDVMDAMGKDVVVIETVGVGQGELDIARLAHTVVLVLTPGYGDSLQAMKAGVLEIADIIAVNKGDTDGAEQSARDLMAQGFQRSEDGSEVPWEVPVLLTSARRETGVEELLDTILEHRDHAASTGRQVSSNRARRRTQFLELLTDEMRRVATRELSESGLLDEVVARIESGDLSPVEAVTLATDELSKLDPFGPTAAGAGVTQSIRR
ncbi:MAG: methylmalonyl Co-A mutase-associated GTPase MeaB [Microthrixaceae bacterium]